MVNLDLPKTMEDYVHIIIGKTRRAWTSCHATSFYTYKDLLLVAQIRRTITYVESGNTMAFAIRKVARRKEREEVATFQERRFAFVGVTQIGGTTIRVDDRYKHIITPSIDTN